MTLRMVTDDERRRVARRLRDKKAECEERGYPWMCDDLILALGYDHDYEAGDEIFDRLADLIEPVRDMLYVTYSRSTCGPDGRAYMVKVRHRTRGWERDFYSVDREALLRLSEGLEKDADRIMDAARGAKIAGQGPRMEAAKRDAYEWRSIARQIRRACGEENELW